MALGRLSRSIEFDNDLPGLEEAFSEVLRHYRKLSGLSQQKLATESNLGRDYISLLERGLRRPSLSTVIRLAHALGTTSAELVQALDEKLFPSPKR